jgi:hypothetical protein
MADNIGIACGRTSYAAAMLGIAVTALIYTLTRTPERSSTHGLPTGLAGIKEKPPCGGFSALS